MDGGSGGQTGMLIVWIVLVAVAAAGAGAYYLARRRWGRATNDDRSRQRSESADE